VRLKLVRVGGTVDMQQPCADNAQCDFPCARQTGATPFDIQETHGSERYAVSVVAIGSDGRELSQAEAMTPAPILREVVRGQPTEVESMQLVADCAMACMMNGSGVCAGP
jgi:hypothetical protein